MYSSYQLKQNPSFKMTGEEFNTIINTVRDKEELGWDKPIKLALSIRTTNTNLVAKSNKSVVVTSDLVTGEHFKGYFRLTFTVKEVLNYLFPNVAFEDIKNTVLLPLGVYEQNGELFIYMHLILQDDQIEQFTNPEIEYTHIKDLYFDFKLDSASLIVLPTLNLVNENNIGGN